MDKDNRMKFIRKMRNKYERERERETSWKSPNMKIWHNQDKNQMKSTTMNNIEWNRVITK